MHAISTFWRRFPKSPDHKNGPSPCLDRGLVKTVGNRKWPADIIQQSRQMDKIDKDPNIHYSSYK